MHAFLVANALRSDSRRSVIGVATATIAGLGQFDGQAGSGIGCSELIDPLVRGPGVGHVGMDFRQGGQDDAFIFCHRPTLFRSAGTDPRLQASGLKNRPLN